MLIIIFHRPSQINKRFWGTGIFVFEKLSVALPLLMTKLRKWILNLRFWEKLLLGHMRIISKKYLKFDLFIFILVFYLIDQRLLEFVSFNRRFCSYCENIWKNYYF